MKKGNLCEILQMSETCRFNSCIMLKVELVLKLYYSCSKRGVDLIRLATGYISAAIRTLPPH